jgi:hypothetical protein
MLSGIPARSGPRGSVYFRETGLDLALGAFAMEQDRSSGTMATAITRVMALEWIHVATHASRTQPAWPFVRLNSAMWI